MAGFEVVGVDRELQPQYPFHLLVEDVLSLPISFLRSFDLIWASPPCQGFTAYKRRPNHVAPCANLIPQVRQMLQSAGRPYIIENVMGAPLEAPVMLCGSMFGLDVQRHRYFETSFPVYQYPCQHWRWKPRFTPASNRTNLRRTVEVGVWRIPLEVQQRAMGIDWMSVEKLSQAIPPRYAKRLGEAAMAHIRRTNGSR